MNNEQTQISLDKMIRELRQIRYLLSEVNDNVKKSNLLLEHQNALPVKKSNQLREEMFPLRRLAGVLQLITHNQMAWL